MCGFTKTKSNYGPSFFWERREIFFWGGGGLFESKYHPSVCNNKQTNDAKAAFAPRVFLEPMIFWEFSTNRPSVGRLFLIIYLKENAKEFNLTKKAPPGSCDLRIRSSSARGGILYRERPTRGCYSFPDDESRLSFLSREIIALCELYPIKNGDKGRRRKRHGFL